MFNNNVITPFILAIEKFGSRNAFYIDDHFYTYLEFAGIISSIRYSIQQEEVTDGKVGLVANNDIETYASIFAIWLEGYAYVPLHPKNPVERDLEIIDQAGLRLLLDSSPKSSVAKVRTLNSKNLKSVPVNIQPKPVSDYSLAYILFTSGSTGIPKGVQITRKNVGAFMKSFWETGIRINEADRCLQCFDLTFDVSVQSFLVPLTRGACCYTIPHDQIKYSYVYGLLEDHKLTFGAMAPSMVRYLRPYFDEINVPDMLCNILTAEASAVDLVNEWTKCIPNAEIYNFYGPTEATIYCTYYKYTHKDKVKQYNGMLSIGKPMPGTNTVIVNEGLKVLDKNQKGELCLSGDQLTTGYWNNHEKNKESFFELDYNGKLTRFYRTGDFCFYDDDGDIMLVGRLDHQVKIQGYRVELGEIEYYARAFLNGRNTIACAFNNSHGITELALFIEGSLPDEKDLIAFLSDRLPNYMIPSRILTESSFPLTTSGKVDRVSLKKRLNE